MNRRDSVRRLATCAPRPAPRIDGWPREALPHAVYDIGGWPCDCAEDVGLRLFWRMLEERPSGEGVFYDTVPREGSE
jgi:hypothetical protein